MTDTFPSVKYEGTVTDTTVATEIWRQLGGRRFQKMTGAKSPMAVDAYTLAFGLPGGGGRVLKGINAVEIRLDSSDTYTLIFLRTRRKNGVPERIEIERREGIYNDNLREVFTRVTGLETRL